MSGSARRATSALAAIGALCVFGLGSEAASAAAPTLGGPTVTAVSATAVTLKGTVNPGGAETSWRFAFGSSDCSPKPNPCKFTPKGKITTGTTPVVVEKALTGLTPGSVYHYLLEAENSEGPVRSSDRVFATLGTPAEGLPDQRAYEQASPTDKDGGDALGELGLPKAAAAGNGITFQSSFGLPGGKGAGALPSYLALRGEGEAGWATQGMLPPPIFGEHTQVQGWLPDFSKTYSNVEKLGSPRLKAMVEQSTSGAPPTIVSPYTAKAEYSYVGANADDSIVFFEAEAQVRTKEVGGSLITGAVPGRPNVYAWNRATEEVSLAGTLNSGQAPPRGTFAGPYSWSAGINPDALRTGGSALGYYLQGAHAISDSGAVYFTEVGSGQLYERLNPTQPQSPMEGEKCLEPQTKACTIHVSASRRTPADPAGPQPAAFQAASADGSVAYFTSPEKLITESNTGPEQPEAAIQKGSSSTPQTIEAPKLVEKHAIGVAVAGTQLYWADPTTGAIGRSNLDGSGVKDTLIAPGPGECEVEVKAGVIEKVSIPSTPRYLAVDAAGKYVYWTNGGLRDNEGTPIDGGGTIGRAELDGAGNLVKVEPAFICGEVEASPGVRKAAVSNPQGIAVDTGHVYWANAAKDHVKRSIARAVIDGGGVEAKFIAPPTFGPSDTPEGVAVDGSQLYFGLEEGTNSSIKRTTLAGTEAEGFFVGEAGIQGVALDGTNLYWATQGEEAIGRVPLADFKSGIGGCPAIPSCENEFIKLAGEPNGLGADGAHLYWSVNGEAPSNPGNDLYRFKAGNGAGTLEDLSYDPSDEDGAEVQGVLGASADGSYLYFAANGDLDAGGKATRGNCQTSHPHGSIAQTKGSCNVYLWHAGTISFVGRVEGADATDWTGTPLEVFGGFVPKSAFVSKDGQTLLFGSREKLSPYENEGVAELYRFHLGAPALACVSCPPGGEAPEKGPRLGSVHFPGTISPLLAFVAMIESRNLSSDGGRAFFESAEALVPGDTNGQLSCPGVGTHLIPACQDVYEWEAPGSGSCSAAGPAYSPLDEGCLYLISTGKSTFPSFFADASESGDDAFFFTRERLVGQDKDELQDVYDARARGGIPAQNRVLPPPCESVEACHGPYPGTAAEASPGSAGFVGPANPRPKHHKQKPKHKKKHKHHKHAKANAGRRAGR